MTINYQIPLRPDLNVGLQNIPTDLTQDEADRLKRVLDTLVIPERKP